MCGIAGYLNFNGAPVSEAIIENMSKLIEHRGPDGEGYFFDENFGVAHRRLSIIDLSADANQPMKSDDNRFVIAYNGELFNFLELRDELEKKGFYFRTHSDTEVVLKSLIFWGIDALEKFNGQFSFAFWDCKKRELLLGRDRYGIKPLYFSKVGNSFVFGSEVKAVLRHPQLTADLDKEALVEYLSFQNFFTSKTLFSGIKILEAGTWLKISNKDQIRSGQYWDFRFQEPENSEKKKYQDCREELDFLLKQAVERQLVGDVEVSSYLSGGMDSGSIASIASKKNTGMKTFTCGFDLHSASGLELGMDERQVAEHLSYLFNTEHYQVVLKAGDMERVLPKLNWHIEEPRVGQSYPNFYVAQLASKFSKVVLSGDGGDELFAGYPWRYYRAVNNKNFDDYIDKYHQFWQRLLPVTELKEMLKPIFSDVSNVCTRTIFKDVFPDKSLAFNTQEDFINQSLYFEAKTFLHGLLVVEDKISMANGLETRVPFLDNDLVEFAMNLPLKFKLGSLGAIKNFDENEGGPKTEKYFQRTRDGKLILRDVMGEYVPSKIAQGIKKGFSGPDGSWFKGDSIDYVNRTLMGPDALIFNYMDRAAVQTQIQKHMDGNENKRLLIWSLLNLEIWLKTLNENRW